LQRSGRCPRCGYVLRFDGVGYSCDFCGYPRDFSTVTGAFHGLGKEMKIKAQGLLEKVKRPLSRQVFVYYPVAVRPCVSCGLNIPLGTARCPNCGTPQQAPLTSSATEPNFIQPQGAEKRVLDYIIAHNGTISLTQASQELTLSTDDLRSALERLKAAGFLNQA
jgi:hypothetical protein